MRYPLSTIFLMIYFLLVFLSSLGIYAAPAVAIGIIALAIVITLLARV